MDTERPDSEADAVAQGAEGTTHFAEEVSHQVQSVHDVLFAMSDRIWIKDTDLRLVYANEMYARDIGTVPEELVGKRDTDIFGAEQGSGFEAEDRAVMERGEVVRDITETGICKLKIPIMDAAGKPVALVLVATIPGQWEPGLATVTAWTSLVLSAADAIVGLSKDGTVAHWPPGAESLFGCTAAEVQGRPVIELAAAGEREAFAAQVARASAGEVVRGHETRCRLKSGEDSYVSVTISPVLDMERRVSSLSLTAQNITERVRMEQNLRRALFELAESHDELGRMAYVAPSSGQSPKPHCAEIETVARRLREDPYHDRDFRAIAAELHISYGHFRGLFRRYMGKSPYDYLLLWRMRKAARALRDDDRPIKAVAAEAGYGSAAQFSRLFKRMIGIPPKQFREAARA
jgi:PAS domain S-box-containing protein